VPALTRAVVTDRSAIGTEFACGLPADPSLAGVAPDATVTVAIRPWPLTRSIASAATMTISESTLRIAERRSGVPYLRCVRFQLPRSNIQLLS
jgi:hypothetical protein